MDQPILAGIIKHLMQERDKLSKNQGYTEEEKKNQRERFKIVSNELHKYFALFSKNKLELNQQKIDMKKEERLRNRDVCFDNSNEDSIESEVGFIDSDSTNY